jgi:hypothetical protein
MRAARALLRWSALDLAKASKVGVATIRRAEVAEGEIEAALRRALEAAGVEFTRPGVRLSPEAVGHPRHGETDLGQPGKKRRRTHGPSD